jgi:hypothetical protein
MTHLNKSQYLTGKGCPRALWLDVHKREGREVDAATQLLLDEGRLVGEWARACFPGGVLVEGVAHAEAVETTRRLMADPGVRAIFEGAFECAGLRVRADILVRQGEGWNLIEVKSSTSAREEHLEDVALTRHVAAASGWRIASCTLRLVSRDFRMGMPVEAFFSDRDVTGETALDPEEVEARTGSLLNALGQASRPEVPIGLHCRNCAHYDECIPDGHVLSLPRLSEKKFGELCALKVELIEQIPDRFSLTVVQRRMRDALKTGRPQAEPGLAHALNGMIYPLFFLDFESVGAAFPLYPAVAPHEQVPTQYSVHVLRGPGASPEHREFLHEDRSDPRRPLAERLIKDLDLKGGVVVYSGYEGRMISGLAERFPDLAPALEGLKGRLFDLCRALQGHFYHPAFGGSFSIKQALPALVPELGYDDLVISDGLGAAAAYREMIEAGTTAGRKQEIAQDLRVYCARDSLAMVRLYEALCQIACRG